MYDAAHRRRLRRTRTGRPQRQPRRRVDPRRARHACSSCGPRTPTAREPRPAGRRRLAGARSGSAGGEPLPPRREHPRFDLAHRERHRAGAPDVPGRARRRQRRRLLDDGDGIPDREAAVPGELGAGHVGCRGRALRRRPDRAGCARSPPNSPSRAPRSATRARCPIPIRPDSPRASCGSSISLRLDRGRPRLLDHLLRGDRRAGARLAVRRSPVAARAPPTSPTASGTSPTCSTPSSTPAR